MIARPRLDDVRIISFFTGKIVLGIAGLMLIPFLTALCFREWSICWDFLIGIGCTIALGNAMILWGMVNHKRPAWIHGMVTASFSWLVTMTISAIPYWLSGSYLSFLDAMFDVMSGFTTTGLTLIQDLDHVSNGINMWRHVITFVGGQGMIVMALTFLVKSVAGGYMMYVGEGKDERLLPSVIHTAKAIWKISLVYLVFGTLCLWFWGMVIGLGPVSSFLHGLWIYMAAWSTGGFAPMSQNILYYHSFGYELITIVFFVIGSFNFALHYSVWTGNKKEVYRNIETVSFMVSVIILTALGCYGLAKLHVYPNVVNLLRKGFYQIISGHTTTGFMTIYARQFIREWGDLALLAIMFAMLIGGSACSTAGGFKGLRVGIIFKAIIQETRRLINPESAVFVQRFHYLKEQVLEDKTVRSAALIVILYVLTFAVGITIGCLCGYPLLNAAFEAASVTGNVGLSCGVTTAAMPAVLKITYIIIMWVGRLEFMSVLALEAFIVAGVRRK
jgi:trk system potassium uptake protein TrkH